MVERTPGHRAVHLAEHQQKFIDEVAAAHAPRRFVLVAPVGTGKSSTLLETIAKLTEMRDGNSGRSLLIAPLALLDQYAYRASSYGLFARAVDPQVYRRMQVEGARGSELWHAPGLYVVSPQFLQRGSRLEEILEATWDVVAIDVDASSLGQPWMARTLRAFWISPGVTTALAILSTTADLTVVSDLATTRVVRWDYPRAFAVDIPIEPVRVSLSEAEEEFATYLVATAHSLLGGSIADIRLALSLLRAWGSSLYEVEQILRRAMIATDESPDVAGREAAQSNSVQREGWTNAAQLAFRHPEVAKLLEKFEAIEGDSKWEECAGILARAIASAATTTVIIFTEAAGTASYVAELARESGYVVQLITRHYEVEQDQKAIADAEAGPTIIVTNTLALMGIELSAQCVVHYDLPRDPMVFLVRRSRLRTDRREYLLVDRFVTTPAALELLQETSRAFVPTLVRNEAAI
jgi:hypothetical protein